MSSWRALAIVWGIVLCCALCGSGCGARTAVGFFESSAEAGFTSGVSGFAQGGVTSGAGAFSGGNASGGYVAVSGSGTNGGGLNVGGSHAGATFDAGPGEAGIDGFAGAAGASGAPDPGCDPTLGLVQGVSGCVAVLPPRLLAPLSTATVTSQRPTFHWVLAPGTDGARVELCLDRACKSLLMNFYATGNSGVPPQGLLPGVLFWRVYGRSGGVTGTTTSPTWQLIVPRSSAVADTSWGSTLDVNGDGFADAVIGAPMVGSNQPNTLPGPGRAYLYLGSKVGLNSTPATSLTGPDGAPSHFGGVASSAGDVNGDGYADVIIGASGANGYVGRAYIYLGGPNGVGTSPAATLTGLSSSHGQFGGAVASAGDLNGDGYADVIVGASLTSGDGTGTLNMFQGRAFVFFGSATGTLTTPAITLHGPEAEGTKYGAIVASAGDVNADGFADLVISDSPYVQVSPSAYQAAPAFYVYLGSATGPGAAPAFQLLNQNWMGNTVASALDLNGDGHADLAVGEQGANSASIYWGNASAVALPAAATLGPQAGSGSYNYSLSAGGDINGDGYQDLLASFDQVFMYSGSASGLVDTPLVITPPVTAFGPTIYGFRITQVGDFNRDGYDDVVVGARFDNNFVGRALVYMGSATGLGAMPTVILPGMDGPGGELG